MSFNYYIKLNVINNAPNHNPMACITGQNKAHSISRVKEAVWQHLTSPVCTQIFSFQFEYKT